MEISVGRSYKHWWVILLRGIGFILLSIYLFASPLSGYIALSFLFGLVILLAGLVELLHAYQDRGSANRGWHLFLGIIDIILGIILMSHLAAGMLILRIVVGFYFLFRGISMLNYRHVGGTSAWWALGGVALILFAILIWVNPVFGAMTIIIWTALAFLVAGILNVLLGLRMKGR